MTIEPAARDAVLAHAEAAAPEECCGVLLGHHGRIAAIVQARNLEASATRYLIDPRDHIAARRQARQQGLEVLGFYHSHPASAPVPSASDVEGATYEDAVYLIAGREDGRWRLRAYRIAGGRSEEVALGLPAGC